MSTPTTLLDQAADLLGDSNFANWPKSRLLVYLNDGLRLLARMRPEEFSASNKVTLQQGAQQTLPSDAFVMIRPGAVTVGGNVGRTPRLVGKPDLDHAAPDWQTATPTDSPRQIAYDFKEPRRFWVDPPAVVGTELYIEYASEPAALGLFDTIASSEVYDPAIVNYVVYRALSEDEDTAQESRAAAHYAAFLNAVRDPNDA